jgi:Family of unknown function (DUF6293)
MRVLHIATVGEDTTPILVALRDLPVTKLVLLYTEEARPLVDDLKQRLSGILVPVDAYLVQGDPISHVMKLAGQILQEEGHRYDEVFFNVSSGSKMLSCAGLSAAFVHGIKAIGATKDGIFYLPVLKFSYSELLSEPKLGILRAVRDSGGHVDSLADLESKVGVEKSLLSYHIRGGKESKGLQELGLVSVERREYGRLSVQLTDLGRLVLTGR